MKTLPQTLSPKNAFSFLMLLVFTGVILQNNDRTIQTLLAPLQYESIRSVCQVSTNFLAY